MARATLGGMRILAMDVGTGTQDVLLYDTSGPVENSPKLVMPSPTAVAAARIRVATAAGRALVVTGVTAGGGPCAWALEDHVRAGLPAFATPEAARTFDDDLDRVRDLGVTLVSDEEAAHVDGERVRLQDVDIEAVRAALRAFGADDSFDGVAIGVFDHGAAPPDVSDRVFRFEHIARVLAGDADARAFAFLPSDLPSYLTRARAALDCIDVDAPVVFMDNGPAAALGALHDPAVARHERRAVVNVGNMHALAFALGGTRVEAVFEHHTGELTSERLASMVHELLDGTLTNQAVYESTGHGAAYAGEPPFPVDVVAVTGPRREQLLGELPGAHPAAPHGDMMISGCFGLLDGFAYRVPEASEAVARLHARAVPA